MTKYHTQNFLTVVRNFYPQIRKRSDKHSTLTFERVDASGFVVLNLTSLFQNKGKVGDKFNQDLSPIIRVFFLFNIMSL